MKQIDSREIENFTTAVATAVAATLANEPRLVPWTTTDGSGQPSLMWDDDDNLMMVEVPR